MRMRMRGIVLTVLATVFAAGCGDGGSGGSPTVTPTAMSTPTPTVTMVEPCGEGPALTITARSLPGARLDVGWSGICHDLGLTHDTLASAALYCFDNTCTIDGSDLAGRDLGAPLPLFAGGVSVCVSSSFREAVTGTYDACNGCLEVTAKLSVRGYPPEEDAETPCPACVGDAASNDGQKGGTCRGGTTPGAACDVGGMSDLVSGIAGVDSDFGMTSNDCRPAGTSIGDVAVDLGPLTTSSVTVAASVDCVSDAFPPSSCFCRGQAQPNPCADGVCPASGVCEVGPIDSVCAGQPFRPCRSGTGTEDCAARFPGAGTCVDRPRPCFGSRVTRAGRCGTQQGTLVSLFCVPATGSDAIDAMLGFPGPGAITAPVSVLRTPR